MRSYPRCLTFSTGPAEYQAFSAIAQIAESIPNPTQNIRVVHHHNRSYLHLALAFRREV
jgi:hypothetical protein